MWAKIITIKITKDLNYFSLCAFNLFYSQISQFELNYWNKWTFPRHSNLLRCTCICISWYFASLLKCNEFNLGCFQVYRFASVCIASCIVPIACSADRETVTDFYTEKKPHKKQLEMGKTPTVLTLSVLFGVMSSELFNHSMFVHLSESRRDKEMVNDGTAYVKIKIKIADQC